MKRLFNIAFRKSTHRFLIVLTLVAMCLLTFASQLEIFTLGVITKKGPEFFELFAPIKDGQLQRAQAISFEQMEDRFDQIDTAGSGVVTQEAANRFYSRWRSKDFIERAMNGVDSIFN